MPQEFVEGDVFRVSRFNVREVTLNLRHVTSNIRGITLKLLIRDDM